MYYERIHALIKQAAAAEGRTIEDTITRHGISRTTYYRHRKTGSAYKLKDVDALTAITGKDTAEILDLLKLKS